MDKSNGGFVLEYHESGPEIVVYLGLATASIILVRSVVDLITALLKAIQNERGKHPERIKITKRRVVKAQIEGEKIMELNLPLSDDIIKKLNDNIRNAIEERNK